MERVSLHTPLITGNSPAFTGWRKSTKSQEINCVEVGQGPEGVVGLRDSKDPNGPAFALDAATFGAFLRGVKRNEFAPIQA